MITNKLLFTVSLVFIMTTYFIVFGYYRTMFLIMNQYLLILFILPLYLTTLFYKKKLGNHNVIDFMGNSVIPFKQLVVFFLVFQVVDFYTEDGFIGMISLWFDYWVFAVLIVFIMELINYYKNYKHLNGANIAN